MVNSRDPRSTIAAVQHPTEGEGGKTGTWRTFKPVIDASKCILMKSDKTRCYHCWFYCPEGTISKTRPPAVNYEYCKGCGVCAAECPHDAITMEEE
ncbi:MAG: 4Fe-4S binding protein [Candidatus Lokiarchaeota archaeon]|nr:4Fe-4S binding protein [Candidatus Lokiarchaeota archaeon]